MDCCRIIRVVDVGGQVCGPRRGCREFAKFVQVPETSENRVRRELAGGSGQTSRKRLTVPSKLFLSIQRQKQLLRLSL